jgi:signal transduction histidine kinase
MKTGLDVTLGNEQVSDTVKPFLASQLDEVSRLGRLLDEFLTLSRPEESKYALKCTEVDMPRLVRHCLTQLTSLTVEYNVTTHLDVDELVSERLFTDAVKLEQVLLNLIENAIKYAVEGSIVQVKMTYAAGWIIQVQNKTIRENGPTLDLLQPYFRADPLKEGHGLGLWISHRLTILLGGTLRLDWRAFTFSSELSLPATIS